MSGTQPVALFALKVPPGDILVPAVPDAAAMVCHYTYVTPLLGLLFAR
jgi:hypothetical protein